MKVFHCDHCRHLAFFENVVCVRCNHTLAYLPTLGVVGSLDPGPEPDTWTSPLPRAAGRTFRLCRNYTAHNTCNWAVDADDPNPLCESCRLTRTIPDLTRPANAALWYKLEVAKRRLVYTLTALKLPLAGLAFDFLADPDDPAAPRVLTGHAGGLITVNLAEADDAERERRRVNMNEPFRTLLGHMRHESGHWYLEQLVTPHPDRLAAFRGLFGDERADYGEALKKHYDAGPPADWAARHVSAYAAAHPWEDWAETWAHYLHMVDALETAADNGLSLRPRRRDEPAVRAIPDPVDDTPEPFDDLLAGWLPLTYLLNNLNRGLGLPDGYPFVLSPPAVDKLRFVHDVVTGRPAP